MKLHLGMNVTIARGSCKGEQGVIRLRMGDYWGVHCPPHRQLQWYPAEALRS